MKRVINRHYFTYLTYIDTISGICVKCTKCNGFSIVTVDDNTSYFKCINCGNFKIKERIIYYYDVHNQCKECG